MDLDFMPSPVADRPGLLIRDPFHYSDATLIVPPALVPCLECFDGQQTELDLRSALVSATGDLQVGELERHLLDTLSNAGFLEDEVYQRMKEDARQGFANAPKREAIHAGSAYPDTPAELDEVLGEYMADGAGPAATTPNGSGPLVAIAAPHVSPEGGWQCYRAAYQALGPQDADRTFVILGTSHYGNPDRFGMTRKPFVTPYGEAQTDLELVNRIAALAGGAVEMEDYCHSMEHSIEFQVIFLQHLFGPNIRIVPILCGSFARSIYLGGKPEEDDDVNRMIGTLGDTAAHDGDKLLWVLGVDMAHIGRRYGDRDPARAGEGHMIEVGGRDRERMDRIQTADPRGFWDLVQQRHDDLKWCGSAPFYTFLKAIPGLKGDLRHYEQWNIDDLSVVSFAGMTFTRQ
jgi:MEMO1 family protein